MKQEFLNIKQNQTEFLNIKQNQTRVPEYQAKLEPSSWLTSKVERSTRFKKSKSSLSARSRSNNGTSSSPGASITSRGFSRRRRRHRSTWSLIMPWTPSKMCTGKVWSLLGGRWLLRWNQVVLVHIPTDRTFRRWRKSSEGQRDDDIRVRSTMSSCFLLSTWTNGSEPSSWPSVMRPLVHTSVELCPLFSFLPYPRHVSLFYSLFYHFQGTDVCASEF